MGTPREEVPSFHESRKGLGSCGVVRKSRVPTLTSDLVSGQRCPPLGWRARPTQIRPPLHVLHPVTRSSVRKLTCSPGWVERGCAGVQVSVSQAQEAPTARMAPAPSLTTVTHQTPDVASRQCPPTHQAHSAPTLLTGHPSPSGSFRLRLADTVRGQGDESGESRPPHHHSQHPVGQEEE